MSNKAVGKAWPKLSKRNPISKGVKPLCWATNNSEMYVDALNPSFKYKTTPTQSDIEPCCLYTTKMEMGFHCDGFMFVVVTIKRNRYKNTIGASTLTRSVLRRFITTPQIEQNHFGLKPLFPIKLLLTIIRYRPDNGYSNIGRVCAISHRYISISHTTSKICPIHNLNLH